MTNHRPSRGNTASPSEAFGDLGSPTPPTPTNAAQWTPTPAQAAILMDVWLTIASGTLGLPLAALVSEITTLHMPEVRSDALTRRTEIIQTIIANFNIAAAIAIPLRRDKATRYDRPVITGRQLKPTVDALEAALLINRTAGIFKERRTTIAPTATLVELIAKHHVTTASITRLPDEEVIILKRRKTRRGKAPRAVDDSGASSGDGDGEQPFFATNHDGAMLIDYPDDCQEANALRRQLRAYNTFLSQSDIRIEDLALPPPFKPFKRIYASSGPIMFNSHGRLYAGQVGGWHQALPKEDRHHIRINGESVVDLDFTNMHLRLAYCEARCSPPDGVDLYAIPELEAHRAAVKICVSSMLSRSGPMKRLPDDARPLLPKEWTGQRISKAIMEHHAPIAHLFGKGKGLNYMWQDSEIMLAVLTRLMHKHIPALPMHDGIMVQASKQDIAVRVMKVASKDLLGFELLVKLKTIRNSVSH
jgi:DNA-binding MarR family transcriptional regulator